jgi:hypothetical protein
VTRDELAQAAQAALAGGRRLERVERLTGGSRKGVYRLTMDAATTAVAYRWEASENYWPAAEASDGDSDLADPFSPGYGLGLFEVARARLESLGLRVPELYLVDRDRTYAPTDLAIVEDFPGENLESLLARDPERAAPTMARLAEGLKAMRAYRAPAYGNVSLVDGGGTSRGASCEADALAWGLRCLADATARDLRIANVHDRLEARLHALAAAIRPRAEYSVVHGELGLDHVLVDRDRRPVLIDIEDLMYYDVEWEHVFLRLRTHEDYRHVSADDLDEDRLALYMLVQRLSLTAGPLRLLEGDFPDREFMRGIAEHHGAEAVAWATAATDASRLACCSRLCWMVGYGESARSDPI